MGRRQPSGCRILTALVVLAAGRETHAQSCIKPSADPVGYNLVDTTGDGVVTITVAENAFESADSGCAAGYTGTAVASCGTDGGDFSYAGCDDIDECTAGTHTCDANAACTNTDGSFTCACNSGYTGAGQAGDCADDDECTAGTHTCDANAACTNTDGSFTCACNSGYTGAGQAGDCADDDECTAGTHTCDANAACTNTDGSFTCACSSGYTGAGQAGDCASDCDSECDGDATCQAQCIPASCEAGQYILSDIGACADCPTGYLCVAALQCSLRSLFSPCCDN